MKIPLWLLRKLTISRIKSEPTLNIRAVSPHFLKDEEIVSMLVRNRPDNLGYVDAALYNNIEFSKRLVMQSSAVYRFTSAAARADKEITLLGLRFNHANLRYTTPELRNDREVVLTAMRAETFINSGPSWSPSFDLAGPDVKADPEVSEALRKHIDWKQKAAEEWGNRYW